MSLDYRHANEIIITKTKNVLWLGDCTAAEDIEWVRKNNVRVGIFPELFSYNSCCWTWCQVWSLYSALQIFASWYKNLKHVSVFWWGWSKNWQRYVFCYVGLKWGSVLVHCGAGVSRVLFCSYIVCNSCFGLSN